MSLRTYFYDDNKSYRLKIFVALCLIGSFGSMFLDYYLDKKSTLVSATIVSHEKRSCFRPNMSEYSSGNYEERSIPKITYIDPFSLKEITKDVDCEAGGRFSWETSTAGATFDLRIMKHPFLSLTVIAVPGQSLTAKILFPFSQYSINMKEYFEMGFLVFGFFFFMFYSEWGRKKLSKIFGDDFVSLAK